MRDFLVRTGIDPSGVVVEGRSRSTYENAVECGKLLRARGLRRVILVTEASHMDRAVRCFRKQGIDAIPSACRYRATELNLSPLGWLHGQSAFISAQASDTSVYVVTRHGPRFVSILLPQPITSGFLSPDGRWIAFTAPASCTYCTLDIFDLQEHTLWNGPSGIARETSIVWSNDSRALVTELTNTLATVDPDSHNLSRYSQPAGLGSVWMHPLRATLGDTMLTLTDRTTGAVFPANKLAGSQ